MAIGRRRECLFCYYLMYFFKTYYFLIGKYNIEQLMNLIFIELTLVDIVIRLTIA